jgi:peptidoglycan L-alanyl-D-glutamate endopeptidase CwlK
MTLSAASEKKLVGVKPALVKVIRRAAEITKQPFQIVQGNRTLAQQRALYAQGRTKPGPIVTWTLKSSHIGGRAIDYAALVGGKISWNDKHYPAIAKAFKQAAKELKTPIIWGGDWKKTKDWGHIQLA